MPQYGWPDCPKSVRDQVEDLVAGVVDLLSGGLEGAYLHGSLAMGCFNPVHSDVDLLFVTRDGMPVETKRRLAARLLRGSNAPRPMELSFLRQRDLHPWQYPTPFDFHYSEQWRGQFQEQLQNSEWRGWNLPDPRDWDLAAHITITRHRGLCLYGAPIEVVFPVVPRGDYLASIIGDIDGAPEGILDAPVYYVLNLCRVYWYLLEGAICSKAEAGEWAASHLPDEMRDVVSWASDAYRGETPGAPLAPAALLAFAGPMRDRIRNLAQDLRRR